MIGSNNNRYVTCFVSVAVDGRWWGGAVCLVGGGVGWCVWWVVGWGGSWLDSAGCQSASVWAHRDLWAGQASTLDMPGSELWNILAFVVSLGGGGGESCKI